MFIIRSKPSTTLYRKFWFGDGWHFIFDERNKWIVLGKRDKTSRPYRYFRVLFVTYIAVSAKAGGPDYDRQLRLTWGKRSN